MINCQAGVEQNFGATCCLRSQTLESSLRTAAWTVGKGGGSKKLHEHPKILAKMMSARGPVLNFSSSESLLSILSTCTGSGSEAHVSIGLARKLHYRWRVHSARGSWCGGSTGSESGEKWLGNLWAKAFVSLRLTKPFKGNLPVRKFQEP